MPTIRPDKLPRWADAGGTVTEPADAKKDSGWLNLEKPPFDFFNWLHFKVYQWLKYFDEEKIGLEHNNDGTHKTGSIVTAYLDDDAVDASKLRDDAVTDANRAVTTNHIRDLAITTAKITDDAVDASKLRDDAVTDANRAVTTNHIRDVAITTAKIADDAVDASKLRDDPVTDANRAVTFNHIRDGAVTETKINTGAVTNTKLGAGAVTLPKTSGNFCRWIAGGDVDTDGTEVVLGYGIGKKGNVDYLGGGAFGVSANVQVRRAAVGIYGVQLPVGRTWEDFQLIISVAFSSTPVTFAYYASAAVNNAEVYFFNLAGAAVDAVWALQVNEIGD